MPGRRHCEPSKSTTMESDATTFVRRQLAAIPLVLLLRPAKNPEPGKRAVAMAD